jgi:Poly(ADP-ribose) polymerase and DNA-Ligase Zn-finger region
MPHIFELAPTGRAKCRGCDHAIARGDLRFGERVPNPFGEGEMTSWFHPMCAAYKRPEAVLQALADTSVDMPDRERLEAAARNGVAHRRLPRIDGAERSPTAQAKCRHCHEPIARGTWRIKLAYYEEGRFSAGGYVHLDCRHAYFETDDVLDRLLYFSPALSDADRDALSQACAA